MKEDDLKLGDKVRAPSYVDKPKYIHGIIYSFVQPLFAQEFAVVLDGKGRTHHCYLGDLERDA